jgi:Undecaprenyl-phosphate glucose phosphotransferase
MHCNNKDLSRTLDHAMTSATLPREVVQIPSARRRLSVAVAKLVIQEFLVVLGSAYAASVTYQGAALMESSAERYLSAALFLAVMVELISLASGHYKNIQAKARHAFLWSGVGAIALAFSFLLSVLFLLKFAEPYSRATFVFQFITVQIAVLSARAVLYSRLQSAIAAGRVDARRMVLIGDPTNCARFSSQLKGIGIRAVGSYPFPERLDPDGADRHSDRAERELRTVIEACRRVEPDDILILAKQDSFPQITNLVSSFTALPVGLHVVFAEAAEFLAAARIVEFGSTLTMQVWQPPMSMVEQIAKRVFDVVVATSALVVLSPLLAMVAIAIKLDSRGPVLFRQTRHGYNNEIIKVFKFRTMTKVEDGDHFVQAVQNDERLTRVGRLLRRANIDELPQLINVLSGEMSTVGPRPHATAHNKMFEGKISLFSRRHVVKPGITGWAQVNGYRGATDTLEKMQRRVEHDLYYIDNWSLWFDFRIIIMTIFSKSAYENAY